MNSAAIIAELSKSLDPKLAKDIVSEFMELKRDYQSMTLSRASLGKFTETVVQILEFIENGSFSTPPSVDSYLKGLESRSSTLNDDLRICTSRIARSVYTLRNKRNILHKGKIDVNMYDLKYAFSAAQWILTELVKEFITADINKAGEIVDFIQIPVSQIVESIGGRKIIHIQCSVEQEILILLNSEYPKYATSGDIQKSLDRRAKSSISNSLKKMWKAKLIHQDSSGYILTQNGLKKFSETIKQLTAK